MNAVVLPLGLALTTFARVGDGVAAATVPTCAQALELSAQAIIPPRERIDG